MASPAKRTAIAAAIKGLSCIVIEICGGRSTSFDLIVYLIGESIAIVSDDQREPGREKEADMARFISA